MSQPQPVSDRLAALGGTHHGRVVRLPVSPDSHDLAPRSKPRIRLVMDGAQLHQLFEGKKDRHARLWTEDDPEEGHAKIGDRLAVSKPAAATACHVKVTEVTMLTLAEFDHDEVKRHGFKTPTAFMRSFLAANDSAWRRLGKDALAAKPDAEVRARWDEKWADNSVWIYTFAYDPLQDERWPIAGAGKAVAAREDSDAGRGYTRNPELALDSSAPAVDNGILETYASDGRTRLAEHRAEETAEQLERRTACEDDILSRMAETVVIARSLGIDPRSQMRMVGRALQGLERVIAERCVAQREAA